MVSPVLRGLRRALRAAGGPLGWCRKYHVVHVAAVAMVAARLLLAATVDLQAEAQLQAELQAANAALEECRLDTQGIGFDRCWLW